MLKKLVYRLLCNNITGSVIYTFCKENVPDLRWPGFKFRIPQSSVNKEMTASVFWGFYESSEIRFVEKYFRDDLDVIELGSSIGIVSSHIASKLGSGRRLITVEANPFLIETINTNLQKHHNPASTFEVLNKAIGYDSEEVMITITNNNTETRVVKSNLSGDTVAVKTIGLADLIQKFDNKNYALVCDIEGSEVEMLMRETDALKKCSQLFIELHDTVYENKQYNVQMLKDLIVKNHGFKIVDEHGPVVVFAK